jgi:4-hydroxybenzoate polyprenyltransferase/phosphoserine phosphatase
MLIARHQHSEPVRSDVPLCVDLDGTLIRSDLLHETLVLLAKERPWLLLAAPLWLLRGKAHFKQRVAAAVTLDVDALPYDARVLDWLASERKCGRRIVLATAADASLATRVADKLGLFESVVASDGRTNLGAHAKRDALVERFGKGGFEYAGDARADLPVWSSARRAIVVNAPAGLERDVRAMVPVDRVFSRTPATWRTWLKAIRVRQWLKNLLVFVPLIASHALGNLALLGNAALAFVALSLTASGIYLVNDLLDLRADRRHATKRKRPFASGALPIRTGVLLAPLLVAAGFTVAFSLPAMAVVLLAVYLVTTTLYSFWLKRKMLVDVFGLSFLYTLRVLIGAAATGVLASPWLLAFAIFVFLSLAFAKRAAELTALDRAGREEAGGRAYYVWDAHAVGMFGVAGAFSAAIVMALYMQSDDVRALYRQPTWLWLMVPLVLYWLTRVWLLTRRGALDEDPIVFATTDRLTYVVAGLAGLILCVATYATMPIPGTRG